MTRPVFQNPHLDGRSFYYSGTTNGVLLLHGFTATTLEVRPLGEYFNSNGYSVLAPLLPGHGTQPEDMFKIHWRHWAVAAENAYLELKQTCTRVMVAGESMGGLLSLYLASKFPEISGVLLLAPAIKISGIWKACWLAPFIKIKPKEYLRDEDESEDGSMPWQGYNVLPLPGVCQLSKLQKQIIKILPTIFQPILILQGEKDKTINPHGARLIYEMVGSKDKQLIFLSNSGHCVALDRDLPKVKTMSVEFLQRILS